MRNKPSRSARIIPITIFSSILIAVVITVASMTYYKMKIHNIGLENIEEDTNYDKHYAFIIEDGENLFWENVYKGAREKGEQLNIYVEKFGKTLPVDYRTKDLVKMAIAANVDGIIMQGNADEDTKEIINEADQSGVPVVTVLGDAPRSDRVCFVGVNNYQLGKKYADQVLEVANENTQRVMVLLDSTHNDSSPDIVLSGINDTLANSKIEVAVTTIDRKSAFSSEEAVHDIILGTENVPDILICLNPTDTICAYQTLVDYNKVGDIKIIGYYNSENISQAIKKQIIHSTIVINTKEMGAYAVAALHEYSNTRRVSEYIPVDMELISKNNLIKD